MPADVTRRAFMLSGDLSRTARLALGEGEAGLRAVGFELFRPVLPMLASPAESVARGGRELRARLGRVEARRDPHPDPPPRRRGADLHPQPQRHHRRAARDRRGACARLPLRAGGARRRGDLDGRRRPGRVPGHGRAASTATRRRRAIATFLFDVLHLDGDDLLDAPLAERAARLDAIAPRAAHPGRADARPGRGRARARRGARRRARGRRRQGRGLAVRRRAARQGVAQGQAGPYLRPGRARRRVGPRAAAGLALEPPPRRARPGRRLRDGRQDVQGADR